MPATMVGARRRRFLGVTLPHALMALSASLAIAGLLEQGGFAALSDAGKLAFQPRQAMLDRGNLLILAASLLLAAAVALMSRFRPAVVEHRPSPRQERWQFWSAAAILLIGSVAFFWASTRLFAMRELLDAAAMDIGVLAAATGFAGMGFLVAAALALRRGRRAGRRGVRTNGER